MIARAVQLRRWGLAALVALALGVAVGGSLAQAAEGGGEREAEQAAEEPDYVELAAVLVRDGHDDRAARELAKVDPRAEGVDRPLYYTLQGLIALRSGDHAAAVRAFDDAIRYGQSDEIVFVYLAQAYYGLRDWDRVVLSVRNADEAGEDIPDLYLMKAHAHRELGQKATAWETLEQGQARFADQDEFLRQQVFLLIDMGLYQEATQKAQRYLTVADVTLADYIAIGDALTRAGEYDRAQRLLEEARLRFAAGGEPDYKATVHLAHAYMASGDLLAAGELLQIAAEHDTKHLGEAAELFRRAGAYERALYMNAQVSDQAPKFKQRVAILVDQKRFERLASLESRLARLGLLDDQKILYALAYAKFQTGDLAGAERLLKRVTDPDLFESAVELRRTIQKCADDSGLC